MSKELQEIGAKNLEAHGIVFLTKNGGAHLVVEGTQGFIDYWPGTGRWAARSGVKGFGSGSLITAIETGAV